MGQDERPQPRQQLHGYISTPARDGWYQFASAQGVNVTALLEALGLVLAEQAGPEAKVPHERTAAQEQRQADVYQYLGDLWYETLQSCADKPRFLEPRVTRAYQDRMPPEERATYDVYCYKVWAYVEDIVAKGFHTDPQFSPIIEWTITYHLAWLERNPMFFPLAEFWDTIDKLKGRPQLVLTYFDLPTKDGDIDWDIVSKDYHEYILGPFAPEMVSLDATGVRRNLLVSELLSQPIDVLLTASIADFGCGPGNLLPHLSGRVAEITGIDKSERALEIAADTANQHGIGFHPHQLDFRYMDLGQRFDRIIAINSILPQARADVLPILETIRRHLTPGGRLMAIMPSFDTNVYLRRLWLDYYSNALEDPLHAARIIDAFARSKKVDEVDLLYAEDGRSQQAYHTVDSIRDEFSAAGLRLIKEPTKVYYPWELVRRFDYGYFPDAPEEIWDWYVVAEPAP